MGRIGERKNKMEWENSVEEGRGSIQTPEKSIHQLEACIPWALS